MKVMATDARKASTAGPKSPAVNKNKKARQPKSCNATKAGGTTEVTSRAVKQIESTPEWSKAPKHADDKSMSSPSPRLASPKKPSGQSPLRELAGLLPSAGYANAPLNVDAWSNYTKDQVMATAALFNNAPKSSPKAYQNAMKFFQMKQEEQAKDFKKQTMVHKKERRALEKQLEEARQKASTATSTIAHDEAIAVAKSAKKNLQVSFFCSVFEMILLH